MIRAIATDIDGTFLTTNRTYDHQLFNTAFQLMQHRNVKFIVASGLTVDQGEEIACGQLKMNDVEDIIAYVDAIPDTYYVVCGRQFAYVKDTMPEKFKQGLHRFYTRTKVVKDFSSLNDKIFKFALVVPPANMRTIAHKHQY